MKNQTLPERLRELATITDPDGHQAVACRRSLREAADRIEALEAALRDMTARYCDMARDLDPEPNDPDALVPENYPEVRAVRALLEGK